MFKLIAICALLCTTAHQGFAFPESAGETELISSRTIETHLPNPIAVVIDSTIYTVSKAKRSLSVYSSEATCKLITDPLDENIQGRIKAVASKNAKKIIVWGIQSSNAEGAVRSTYYTLLIVDPLDCTYIAVSLPEDKQPTSWPLMLPQLIVSDKTFDVFYPTHQRCAPCRFEFIGYDQGLRRQIPQQSGIPSKHFWIKEYFANKYNFLFHAYNLDNGTALIERVDNYQYRTATKIYVNHSVDAASVAYGSYQNTAICYISSENRQEVRCERLNKRLLPALSWNLPTSNHPITDIFIEVDTVGNTFIGTISSQEVRFFVYHADGDKVANWVSESSHIYPHQEVHGLRIGDEYCVEAVMYSDSDAQETQQVIDCFNVTNYILSI